MSTRNRRTGLFALIVALIISFISGIPEASAQGGETQGQAPGSTTIHIVQRDENLFRIAMQYGTTVEAISAANGITDPRYIAVGQRLLIPNVQINATGALVTHVVAPGDSLDTLSRLYHTTPGELAAANFITNPHQMYAGQILQINQGAAAVDTLATGLYRVQPGENLYRIAVRFGVSLSDLLAANDLDLPAVVFPGQRLWLPAANGAHLLDLPPLFASYALSPVPAIQGESFEVHFATTVPATVAGTFMDAPVQFMTLDGTDHYALIGVHAFTEPGIYPLALTVTGGEGAQSALTVRLKVESGGYGTESIALSIELEDLLNPDVTEPEWQQLATLMSGFTPQRYFDGVMGLPSSGAITSQYGTRRDYNNGALDTFHSGTDFGAAPGSPIVAPAGGVVVLAEPLPVRGNATIIDHGWGVYTGYWHQSEIQVRVGDVVAPGQVIGMVGSTGRVTGPHLHWEMWVGGVQVDPMQWVRESFP